MTLKKIKYIVFLQLILSFIFSEGAFAQFTIPEVPKFQTSVYDYANVLNASEKWVRVNLFSSTVVLPFKRSTFSKFPFAFVCIPAANRKNTRSFSIRSVFREYKSLLRPLFNLVLKIIIDNCF